jgi:hypothetical protein
MAKKVRLVRLSLFQALGVFGYCSLVGVLFWRGETWFGKVPNYWGPLLFLILFSTSALICAVITLGYPAILIWRDKQPVLAVKLAGLTAGWLAVFTLLVLTAIILRGA